MANTEKQDESAEIKSAGRSASYPWIDLATAEQRLILFWKAEKTYEAPVSSAVEHWGYGAKSSGGRLTVAAMLSYGLMSDRGASEQRMLKISSLGVELMMAPSEEAKLRARKAAALKPRLFAELLKTMDPQNLPSDQTIAHLLVTQKGFNPTGAENFIKTFKGTLKHAGLERTDIMPSTESVATPPGAGQEGGGLRQEAPMQPIPMTTPPATPPAAAKSFKQDVYNFADGGQVILQWPEGMSRESFEEFEDWIELQVRKIARASGATKKKD